MKFKSIVIAVFVVFSFVDFVNGEGLYSRPESVIFDTLNQRYLVSEPDGGSIIEENLDGAHSYFATGLSIPLGLKIVDQYLYCAAQGVLYIFDLTNDQLVETVSTPGASDFLNALTADTSGYIYATDYPHQTILQFRISDRQFINTWDFNLNQPNGLCFDKTTNQLLILEENLGDIVGVDLATLNYSTVFNSNLGACDGLTQDNQRNFYLSDFNTQSVYLIDPSFTQPESLLFDSFNGPADISYDKINDILAVPNLNGAKVDFFEMKYTASCDTTYGAVPFSVNFTGQSEYNISQWDWDFGDGDVSSLQSPNHIYTAPGVYTTTMRIISNDNDTLYRELKNFVAFADTLKVDTTYGVAGESTELIVYGNNTISLEEIIIPVEYDGSLVLTFDSLSKVGCRTEYFEVATLTHVDNWNKRFVVKLNPSETNTQLPLPTGDGAFVKLYFTYHPASASEQVTTIFLDGYSSYLPTMSGLGITYNTEVFDGTMAVTTVPCCVGIRGNVDSDPMDETDISDLVFIVDFIFTGGDAPLCFEEANVDGDPMEEVDISDLVYIVDFIFTGGSEPASCS